jgi:hypothetical protein
VDTINNRSKAFLILIVVLSTFLYFNSSEYSESSSPNADLDSKKFRLENSDSFQNYIITYFNKSTYNNSVSSRFNYYGGIIHNEWNNLFNSFSGFAGFIPSEQNRSLFQIEFPDAQIENNEKLETLMNYASIQAGAINSSWFINGYKGDTNCSVAVLDTGINPTHILFQNGYNPSDLSGDIISWDDLINSGPISDDNGHGTYISSIISGTGDINNSSTPISVKKHGNYSHSEMFEESSPAKNYSLKLFSFNASVQGTNILVNSSWDLHANGIDDLWFELAYDNEIVAYSHNINTDVDYLINYTIPQNDIGIYDLFVKYHKQFQEDPIFSFNTSTYFYPEFFVNNYKYFTGIANGTKIAAYKILNQSGIGYSSDLITALAHVIANRSANHIISVCLSVGTIGNDVGAINNAINEVINRGILVVIAAGNSGVETSDAINKLATNRKAIVVGAINDKDQIASYSSMGLNVENVLKPDIVAPGGSILPTHRTINSAGKLSDEITTGYGTSIATAIVSGAINLMVEAKWGNWNQWNQLNLSTAVKYLKAMLLLTASETNMLREDNPGTPEDESEFSPTITSAPFTYGLKDHHEGYGRINIQAAIEAMSKSFEVNSSINGNLTSSQENPLGTHVFARNIELKDGHQYLFNLSGVDSDADFDMYLFSNSSNQYGEPILLESSRKWYGDYDTFYFTPRSNQTSCVITIKAIDGKSQFSLNVSEVENLFEPELKITEINYFGGVKNTTIMGYQEFSGNEPSKNYSIDSYRFFIEFFDNDSSNVPPQEVYVSILGISTNYTLTQFNPLDDNFTAGVLFVSEYISFPTSGVFQYFFVANDGKFITKLPKMGFFNISIEFPTDSIQFPFEHDFNDGKGNWTHIGTGWDILEQSNTKDNRSRIYQESWEALYFGTYHSFPDNYTYQPFRITEDPYPNGSLFSPLYNITQLNKNETQVYAYFGLRLSINSGDFINLQINLNWTGWLTLRTYTNEETDWFMESINLTDYIGYFIQFRFTTNLDNTFDPINYKGLILDYFALKNYSNYYTPIIEFNINKNIPITHESKYHQYLVSCEYYDLDNNYPQYVYLEIEGRNYTMYNIYGDWNASSALPEDFGILFLSSLNLEEISNQSFRFHISDGKYLNTTGWYNQNNTFFQFIEPTALEFNLLQDQKYIGYEFSNNNLSDYYVSGIPLPKEFNIWLGGDNTWHPFLRLGEEYIYGGIGQSFGGITQGYGSNWDAKLITKPLHLGSEYDIYLEYNYEISLQNEFFQPEDQLDRCILSISKDFGFSWIKLKEYTYETDPLLGMENIDLTSYSGEVIMIMFTLNTNDEIMGLGYGWLVNNIYIGYDKTTDFISPEIEILTPINATMVKSSVIIKANVYDNQEIDESKIYVYLNGKSVDRTKLMFNSTTNSLEFTWDTTSNNDGIFEIRVVAYDKAGNFAEDVIFVQVNNGRWWSLWSPYIILIGCVIFLGIILYLIAEKKGKFWIGKIREARAEKIRLGDIDKDQVIKKIDLVDPEEELRTPLTLYCKYCRSWFTAEKFDMMCPKCDHDQIYAAYNCLNCGKWWWKDEPGEDYYCKSKGCEGIRLIRRDKTEIQELLAPKGKFLRKFEKKKEKFSIFNND